MDRRSGIGVVLISVAWLAGASLGKAGSTALSAQVTLDGVGGVVPGMTPAQVARRWATRVSLSSEEIRPGCRTADVRAGSMRGYALFERRRFGAVWFQRGASTPSGIRIGSTRKALVRAYGSRLRWTPHRYEHGGFYVFLTRRASPKWRIRFDVSRHGRVMQIGFGGRAVAYDEGCA